MWRSVLLLVITATATVNSETQSTEDLPPYTFSFANPSALNFQDIYTNIVTSAEDRTPIEQEPITTTEEINYVLNKESQYVEFHPATTETPTQPPPKYILNSTFIKRTTRTKKTTTTEEPDEMIKVVPMRNVQRGVLDLLFPESRVKTFKNIFDTIKRMLSHTFRR